jgi:hypothetical protein
VFIYAPDSYTNYIYMALALSCGRYFIVIDDIWEIKSWEMIKLALVQDNCGTSRVITTTRKLDVARECGDVYKLEPLPFDKSEKLFYTRIFGSEGNCPNFDLDEASGKMLKKCDGVPLAIITVASLLVGKSREEWIEVCHSIVFRDTKKNQQVTDTEWILSLSYHDLPAHLKTCLLYLSAFPEDSFIEKDHLIWMWVAEGFVHSKEPGTRLFEVGEEYFNELISRSMIQAEEEQEKNFIVIGCRLHDMVLDLLRVRSQEENFITISSSNTNFVEGTSSAGSRVRRLAHHGKRHHEDSLLGMDITNVRTFIASCRFHGTIIDDEVQSFRLLRVLHVDACRAVNLEHVDKLLHLRYLGVVFSNISGELTEGIGNLKFLQTLDIGSVVDYETELPSSLGLLTQLICLRIEGIMLPNGVIEKLTSLQELGINCREHMAGPFVKELGNLHELRVLVCFFEEELDESMQSDLVESLGNLHKIRHLSLYGEDYILEKGIWDTAVLQRPLQRLGIDALFTGGLPSCINPINLPNLTHVDELYVSDLDEHGLKNLAALPELCYLKLRIYNDGIGSSVTITLNDGSFRKLRCLDLFGRMFMFVLNQDSSVSFTLWDTNYRNDVVAFGSQKGIVRAPAIMPSLQVLRFRVDVEYFVRKNCSCDKLGLEYLPSLQDVGVEFTCWGAFADDVERQEAALRHAIEAHPNRPALQIQSYGKDDMKRCVPAHMFVLLSSDIE